MPAVEPLVLPDSLISPADLSRTVRELAALHESLHQAAIRTPGHATKLPRSSPLLEDLAASNKTSLLDVSQRTTLLGQLRTYADKPPRIHISFAVEPSAKFLLRLIVWLRTNINPTILLETGLQPGLAIGCVVRTDNKLLDMSLRSRFHQQRRLLVEQLVGASGTKTSRVEVSAA